MKVVHLGYTRQSTKTEDLQLCVVSGVAPQRIYENIANIFLKASLHMCMSNGFRHSVNKNMKSGEFFSKLTCSWPNMLAFTETCSLDNVPGHCCNGCWAHFLFHILEINKASDKWPWLESNASHERLVAGLRQLGWVQSCEHLFSHVLCHNFYHQTLSSLWSLIAAFFHNLQCLLYEKQIFHSNLSTL